MGTDRIINECQVTSLQSEDIKSTQSLCSISPYDAPQNRQQVRAPALGHISAAVGAFGCALVMHRVSASLRQRLAKL